MKKVNVYGNGISYIDALSFDDYKLCTKFAFTPGNEHLFIKVINLMMTNYKAIFAEYCISNDIDISNKTKYDIAFIFACSLEYFEYNETLLTV